LIVGFFVQVKGSSAAPFFFRSAARLDLRPSAPIDVDGRFGAAYI
jgi:hypothetical protein